MQTLRLPTVADKHDIFWRLLACRANIRGQAPDDLPVGEILAARDAAGRAWTTANDRVWEARMGRASITDGLTLTILPQASWG